MSRADYAHWNEEQDRVWWEEEGKHEANQDSSMNEDDKYESNSAADAFAEELGDMDDEQLEELLHDGRYIASWPKAKPLIEWEIKRRKDSE